MNSSVAHEWEVLRSNRFLHAWACGLCLLHIVMNMTTWISGFWPNVIHFVGFAILCAGWTGREGESFVSKAGVWAVALIAASSTLLMFTQEDAIYQRGMTFNSLEWVAATSILVGALLLTFRVAGWLIPVVIIIALGYVGWWGQYTPGVFRFPGLEPQTILFRTIYGDDAMFGSIASISSSFVMMFIIFGAFLVRSGAGEFIIELAKRAAGRMQGGPGLIAVFSSGLTGTISGSAVANTASTGVITIPMMIKAGYKPRFAAGVEAAASTGGQLMPPIMGAGAFVMANYTQIPYTEIVVVSFLPALLYFFTIGFFVRLEAKRLNIQPEEADDAKSFNDLMKNGGYTFFVPIALLVVMLVTGMSPTYSAGYAIAAVIITSWLTPNRLGLTAIMDALALSAKNMVMTAILLITIGALVNVVSTTGIGNVFSFMIIDWANGQLWLAIILIGLASLVLGMGLPVTAAYIMVATIAAPALSQLIQHADLLEMLTSGQLPAAAQVTLSILPQFESLNFSQAMSIEQANTVIAGIPREIMPAVLDASIDPAAATLALLSAHMIIFWLSQDSNVTPPVCLTAFTAAAIAKCPPMDAGLSAWKLAKGLYFVPFLFAYTEILGKDWGVSLQIFAFSLVGLYSLAAFFVGYINGRLNPLGRAIALIAGLVMMWQGSLALHMAGLALFVALATLSHFGVLVGTRKGVPGQTAVQVASN